MIQAATGLLIGLLLVAFCSSSRIPDSYWPGDVKSYDEGFDDLQRPSQQEEFNPPTPRAPETIVSSSSGNNSDACRYFCVGTNKTFKVTNNYGPPDRAPTNSAPIFGGLFGLNKVLKSHSTSRIRFLAKRQATEVGQV